MWKWHISLFLREGFLQLLQFSHLTKGRLKFQLDLERTNTSHVFTLLGVSSVKSTVTDAFECNLKELTTKSAWVPRSVVFGMRMPGGWLHRSCDSLARSVFPSCWVLSPIFFPSRPPTRLVGFSSTDVCQCDGCLFLSFGVGAHGWVALLCQSWGHYFNLGAGCQ